MFYNTLSTDSAQFKRGNQQQIPNRSSMFLQINSKFTRKIERERTKTIPPLLASGLVCTCVQARLRAPDVDMNGKHTRRATKSTICPANSTFRTRLLRIVFFDRSYRYSKNRQRQLTRSRPIKIQNLWVRCYNNFYLASKPV